MNLDDVLREPRSASLVDHDWWVEGLVKDGKPTYDPSENYRNNNMKDGLEIEWGYGTIEPKFSDDEHPVPSGGVDRNLPPEALGDAGPVIMFARDLMNRGFMGEELQRSVKAKFDQPSIRLAAKELHALFRMEGIIGRIAVDTRGYGNPKQAIAAIRNNPYKRFIKYAIAEQRAHEDYAWLPDTRDQGIVSSESCGNAIDDFFTSTVAEDKGRGHKARLVPHCKYTMMPIYGGMGDLDQSELDETLVELMNLTEMPDAKRDEIVHNDKYATNTEKLQAAFRWLDKVAAAAKQRHYTQSVDASEFMIERRDQEIELFADNHMPELDVDPVNHCLQNQFAIDQARVADSPLDVSIFGEMTDVILASQPTINPLDVSLDGYTHELSIEQKRQAKAPLRIQEREIHDLGILDESIQLSAASTPDVTGLHHSLNVPVDKAPVRRDAFDLMEESNGQMDGLISFDDNVLDIGELDAPLEIDLNPMQAIDSAIDVDVFGGEVEVGLMAEVVAQDVSLAQHEDPMFVGGDFELNERPSRPGDLNVDLGSSMEW